LRFTYRSEPPSSLTLGQKGAAVSVISVAHQPLVITGLGVLAPNGIGKDAFWRNCLSGTSGIGPITLFDPGAYRCRCGGQVNDFHPEAYVGPKGLRTLDRTTRLALVATHLAMHDAGLEIGRTACDAVGVVLGSTMGSLRSISEFDLDGLRDGPRYVNPALFPNAVINSPASQVAIRFGLQGLNATIATGFTAGLDAIGYAMTLLKLGRLRAVIVGGVEELCLQTFLGFYKLGLLATTQDGTAPRYAPYQAPGTGMVLGEGAACVVMERSEDAHRRGASAYAELLSYSTAFHPASLYRYDPDATAAVQAVRQALQDAGVSSGDVDCISSGANGLHAADAMEQTAIHTVFGQQPVPRPVSVVKTLVGESFSAAGALQVATMVGALVCQQVPCPVLESVNVSSTVGAGGGGALPHQIRTVLIQTCGLFGVSSAVVLRSLNGRHQLASS
jgi:3-oxoacyl-[acyl-carrier-protein] synthase II